MTARVDLQPDLVELSKAHWVSAERLHYKDAASVRASFGGNGDVRRLLQIAVCILDHPAPTLTSISKATGQNKGVIDLSVERLNELGFRIVKHDARYRMQQWSPLFNLDAVRQTVMACEHAL